jgi:hypothetical protein
VGGVVWCVVDLFCHRVGGGGGIGFFDVGGKFLAVCLFDRTKVGEIFS